MQPRIRMGLIAGAIGLVLNVCVAAAVGLCGPLVSLLAGGAAGYFAAQQEKAPTKGDGARLGAMAGGIAGALVIVGQLIGGVIALAFIQNTGLSPFGTSVPTTGSDPSLQVIYYLTGAGTSLCFGLIGTALAALAGAGAGYAATPDKPMMAGTPPTALP